MKHESQINYEIGETDVRGSGLPYCLPAELAAVGCLSVLFGVVALIVLIARLIWG